MWTIKQIDEADFGCEERQEELTENEEFCPRCNASLPLQKGYSNTALFWTCRGCGELLINPAANVENDTIWVCDGCGEALNFQEGFSENNGTWTCRGCGFCNIIDESEVYLSEEDYQASLQDPYKGLSDEAVLTLSGYTEVREINGRPDVIFIYSEEDKKYYIKKYLRDYDISIYNYLQEHPIEMMPQMIHLFEGDNCLTVIEEYIEGHTIDELLEAGPIELRRALDIAEKVCEILGRLHNLERPIIHRDIKPSNIVIAADESVYLLDMNIAKWYSSDKVEDTRLFGTLYYAAPEQLGYGFAASSEKSDIYGVGVLLNVMLTGKLPKEEKAAGDVWHIIEKCISFEPKDRYSALELVKKIQDIRG